MAEERELDWEPIFKRIWLMVRRVEDGLQRAFDQFEEVEPVSPQLTYIENQMNRSRHACEKLIWLLRELPGGDLLGDATRPANSTGP